MGVELIDSMGSDLSIVNAARVSFHKRSEWWCAGCHNPIRDDNPQHVATLSEGDRKLIDFLMRNRHATPFEMVDLTFRVRCPIGVAREWMRHRTFSFNEESTRYVEMRPDFYVPAPEDVRTQVGKPGHYTFEPLPASKAAEALECMLNAYGDAYDWYQRLLADGVARELARNVLPLGLLTEFIVKGNLRNWLHFLNLRTAENALLEIRREAQEVERLAETVAPAAMAAWRECGRVSL